MASKNGHGDLTYRSLTDQGKRQVLEARLAQVEAEHYNHMLNRTLLGAQYAGTTEQTDAREFALQQSDDAIEMLEGVHRTIVGELDRLGA